MRVDPEVLDNLETVQLSPEEKGLATIASDAQTIANVFDASLLEEEDIRKNLYKLHLLKIVDF